MGNEIQEKDQIKYLQVNTSLDQETVKMLDRMAYEDGILTRSAMVRRAIQIEFARRYSQPNPLITIAAAEAAHKAIVRGSGPVPIDDSPAEGDFESYPNRIEIEEDEYEHPISREDVGIGF
jgi:hypothetical protein